MHDKDAIYRIIGYSFQDDNLLKDALTAAGANEDNYEGNRTLAQVGKMFVNLMSVKMGYSSGAKPGPCTELKARFSGVNRCAKIAEAIGLVSCMSFSPKPGAQGPKVLNKAINALIGAIYLDSQSEDITFGVLENIRWFSITFDQENGPKSSQMRHQNEQHALTSRKGPSYPRTENSGHLKNHKSAERIPKALMAFLYEETQRCNIHGIPDPRQTYYNESAQVRLNELESNSGLYLTGLFLTIGGPISILDLKFIAQNSLALSNIPVGTYNAAISPPERYAIIHELDQTVSLLNMIKSYHTLRLFEECSTTSTCDMTIEHFQGYNRRPGNPLYLREHEVGNNMISFIFPNLQAESAPSPRQLQEVKKLRRIGKRLQCLVNTFGIGIFGLLHAHEGELGLSHMLNPRVTDTMFHSFISLLKETQQQLITAVCYAISPIVRALINGDTGQIQTSQVGSLQADDILQYPKGSRDLLELLLDQKEVTFESNLLSKYC